MQNFSLLLVLTHSTTKQNPAKETIWFDHASFWANLYLYNYESKYITSLIRDKRFYSTFRVIVKLCALNDGGEIGKTFFEIYLPELQLKVEHNDSHATFLYSWFGYFYRQR